MKLTNLDRVVFPDDGITKGDVVAYYEAVAERMLPHLAGRPLSLERYRKTIDDGGFFQQSASRHFPEAVGRLEVRHNDGEGTTVHPVAETVEALVYLANQGALTLHAWPARAPELECPDALVLDLDPDGEDFAPVRKAALLLRDELSKVGLDGLPMLTGSRGLHVIVALDATTPWAGVWTFAKAIGAALVKRGPKELTRAFYKSQRRGRLYVDTGRARRGQTAVVPYTVRAKPGAPVAAPVTWAEVENERALRDARAFTLRTVLERPADPWDGARWRGQNLTAAAEALGVDISRRESS